MKPSEIIDLLIEEIQEKKSFRASWDVECSGCGDEITEGEVLFFYGDKQKICAVCNKSLLRYLRDLDTKIRSLNEKQSR